MAKSKDTEVSVYCDRVYEEFSAMKEKLLGFIRAIETMTEEERAMLKPHIQHFEDIVRTIDWKLEILMRVCPLDFTRYGGDVERPSVFLPAEETAGRDVTAAGYLGG